MTTVTLPFRPTTPPPDAPRTRVLEITVPASATPRLLVLECEGPDDVIENLAVRSFRIEPLEDR